MVYSLVKTMLLQLMVCCLLQMFLHHMLSRQYLLCTLTTVDTDLLVPHLMELYVHGSLRWEAGVMFVLLNHPCVLITMQRRFSMLEIYYLCF